MCIIWFFCLRQAPYPHCNSKYARYSFSIPKVFWRDIFSPRRPDNEDGSSEWPAHIATAPPTNGIDAAESRRNAKIFLKPRPDSQRFSRLWVGQKRTDPH